MSKHCENCGCKMYSGFCSNCDEESCIEILQGEFIESRSEEWMTKLSEQENRRKLREKEKGNEQRKKEN